MEAERFRRVRSVFDAVVEVAPGERDHTLDALCGDDAALRSEVTALLAAEAGASTFLDGLAPQPAAPPLPSLVGRRLGPYRIERKLAEGGMSTLYVGVRADLVYEQRVAIKVFGFSPDREDLLQRFQSERQILASLNHPSIARLLDGGTTEEGLPYLVMELIEGVPVDRYSAEHALALAARIDLFLQICAAVSYAHRNLVVHRDLKPSNILVDGEGRPKLLDFGIAKLLASQEGRDDTRTGHRLMTPQFASPEQLTGGPITTSTDVYALGALLYVLLTGGLPYRVSADRPGELERAILERQPEPPSEAAPRPLRRALAGDLDNIVLKALAKEPQQRYSAVDLLAEDLRRHRQGLPIAARPATFGYRLRTFVRRHRVGVAVGSGTFLLILGLAISMTLLAVRWRRERDRAVQVTGFLQHIFRGSDAEEGRAHEVTARELLDRGAERLQPELGDQPESQAFLAFTIAKAYRTIGVYDSAAVLLDRATELRRRTFGAESPEAAECLDEKCNLLVDRGQLAQAEAVARQALAIRRRRGESDPSLDVSLNNLGNVLLNESDFAGAEALLSEALRVHRKRYGPNQLRESVPILANLGQAERKLGKLAEAEVHDREAIAIGRREYGPGNAWVAAAINSLAVLLAQDKEDFAGAEAAYREALRMSHETYGAEHPLIALRMMNLAAVLVDRGRWSEAEELLRGALAMQRKLEPHDGLYAALALYYLGDLEQLRGHREAARSLLREALTVARGRLGELNPVVAGVLTSQTRLAVDEGDLGAAEPLALESLAVRWRLFGGASSPAAKSLSLLGSLRLAQGSPAAAEPLLRESLAIDRRALPPDHTDIAVTLSRLGSCLAARGLPQEAEEDLRAGHETLLRKLGPGHPWTADAQRRLAAFLEASSRSVRIAPPPR